MSAPPATSALTQYLAKHPDFAVDPKDATPKNLEAWLAEADCQARGGVRAAYLVGRALRAQRPKNGKVAAWAAEQAKQLGRSPRTVRLYLQVAGVIDAELATPLPISVIDQPLRDVPRAIQNVRAGLEPDVKRMKSPSAPKNAATLVSAGRRVIESIVALADAERSEALCDLVSAIVEAAGTLPPRLARGVMDKAQQALVVGSALADAVVEVEAGGREPGADPVVNPIHPEVGDPSLADVDLVGALFGAHYQKPTKHHQPSKAQRNRPQP